MFVLPYHNQTSQRVKIDTDLVMAYFMKQAKEMSDLLERGDFGGFHKEGVALHHSQVSATPYNFFVTHPNLKELFAGNSIIFNPKILERGHDSYTIAEGCMSFPHRQAKKVQRQRKIRVHFEYPVGNELVPYEGWIEDLAAQIFQHEVEHAQGRNIYHDNQQ